MGEVSTWPSSLAARRVLLTTKIANCALVLLSVHRSRHFIAMSLLVSMLDWFQRNQSNVRDAVGTGTWWWVVSPSA